MTGGVRTALRHSAALQASGTALSKALANLGKGTDGKDLLLIIRKPGWTSIAELAYTNAMLDSAALQLRGLEATMSGLKGAAAKVGGKVVARKAAPKKAAKAG